MCDYQVLRSAVSRIHVKEAHIFIPYSLKEVQNFERIEFLISSFETLLERSVGLKAVLEFIQEIIAVSTFFTTIDVLITLYFHT